MINIKSLPAEVIEKVVSGIVTVPYLVKSEGDYAILDNGERTLRVLVTQELADLLQSKLDAWAMQTTMAYVDYEHIDNGSAGVPLQFAYSPAIGITLTVALTSKARIELIDGVFNYFSSSLVVQDGDIVSLNLPAVGALCNNPANVGSRPIIMYNSKSATYHNNSNNEDADDTNEESKVDTEAVNDNNESTAEETVDSNKEEGTVESNKEEETVESNKDNEAIKQYLTDLAAKGQLEVDAIDKLLEAHERSWADYSDLLLRSYIVPVSASLPATNINNQIQDIYTKLNNYVSDSDRAALLTQLSKLEASRG